MICLSAFISPLRVSRERAREIIGADRFLEVYVSTDLAECERRDIKGLYRKARAGEIAHFTGINSPFEPPENPDITLDTSALPVEESVARVLALLDARGFLSAG